MNKILITLVFISVNSFAAMSGKEIMTRHEEARKLRDLKASAKLTTGGGGKKEAIKEFTWWRKLQKDGVRFNTLTRFHKPAEIKNQGILFLEFEGDKTDVQMYLPAYKKVRRVESQQQSGSFMGSEFSFADIATPHVEDFTYKTRSDEQCPVDKAMKCHVVEFVPVNDSVKERTGNSFGVGWFRHDNFMMEKAEYKDLEGNLWKKLETSRIEMVDKTEKKWMALTVRMEGVKSGRFTLMEFSNVESNKGIADSIFTVQNLSREN